LQHVGIGLGVSAAAALINYVVARKLFAAGQHHKSIALEADAHHLMTDVWTSIGVIVGVAAAAVTGWYVLDPLIAIAVALHIGWVGSNLIGRSARGLLDQALPAAGRAALEAILLRYRADGIDFHAVRTRQAGARVFVALHVLVPDQWSVARGHALLEQIESDIRAALPGAHVFTHLEPLGSPDSYHDIELDR
jgi:cation diffusion facilitator family transporter